MTATSDPQNYFSTLQEFKSCVLDSKRKIDWNQQLPMVEQKRALITGINGQVGSYLAELLIEKDYQVHGIIRRDSSLNTHRLTHLFEDKTTREAENLKLHYGDLTDNKSLFQLIISVKPHEIYNLAAQSHVKISFQLAELTCNTNGLGPLRLLDAIRLYNVELGLSPKIKFYQASTSELFGGSLNQIPQNENTPFEPRSPYACSKLLAHALVKNYRESYKLFAVSGILFNHESPRRGENFVTRKISRSVAEIVLKRRKYFELGNLDARRDWGHARDYVNAMWLMMQRNSPKDYVISSGKSHSVREFVEEAFRCVQISIKWHGNGCDEIGCDALSGETLVRVSSKFMRPSEVDHLLGDSSLAHKDLNWRPTISFSELVREMVESDLALLSSNPSA